MANLYHSCDQRYISITIWNSWKFQLMNPAFIEICQKNVKCQNLSNWKKEVVVVIFCSQKRVVVIIRNDYVAMTAI